MTPPKAPEWTPPLEGLFVVDVSNVCRDQHLPPFDERRPEVPQAQRLRTVVSELRARHGRGVDVRFVADRSLREAFRRGDRLRDWDAMRTAFDIEVERYADPRILEYAYNERRHVVTRDKFFAHRRREPWILACPERFVRPVFADGAWHLRPTGIRAVPDSWLTEAAEKDRLRDTGLLRGDRLMSWVVERKWRCDQEYCEASQNWERRLLSFPYVDDGVACCPECGLPAVPVGPRGTWAEVKVKSSVDGRELYRFPVSADEAPVTLGRGLGSKGISLDALVDADGAPAIDPARAQRLSRVHACVELDGTGRLLVTDLGSANGTTGLGGNRPRRLAENEPWELVPAPPRDKAHRAKEQRRAELGGVVVLERSAVEYVTTVPAVHPRSTDGRHTVLPR